MEAKMYSDLKANGERMDIMKEQSGQVIALEATRDREHIVCPSIKLSICVR